uniref:E3 ubiquitin-protein ligase RNF181 n=1 Tax=Plectus sambesii TaxID=2011161 RepID=A0A914W6Z9_9BILA
MGWRNTAVDMRSPMGHRKLVLNCSNAGAAENQPSVVSEQQCPVCIAVFESTSDCVKMPCKHQFHASCILPWLSKTNSCPVCRYELETDDASYESYRQQKKRRDRREENIQELHDSMFM